MPFLILSLFIHLGLLHSFNSSKTNHPPTTTNSSDQLTNRKDQNGSSSKKITIHVVGNISPKSKNKGKGLKKDLGEKKDCKNYYYGIGIMVDDMSTKVCRIALVTKGSPADKAGLKPGDRITRALDNDCEIRGKKDTLVTLKVIRDDEKQRLITLVRKKICTSD